jgi:hypothetical protein
MEKEYTFHTAKGILTLLNFRTFKFLQVRYRRVSAQLEQELKPQTRIQTWQWMKALIHCMREKGYWHEKERRPMTKEEYLHETAPRVPGQQKWKNYYVDSPAWKRHWLKNEKDRQDMTRWAWRIENGLEANGEQYS